jgi:hypothetical protein
MPEFSYYVNNSAGSFQDNSGSGIGWYGASFGASVNVGDHASSAYITNGAGTVQGAQCWLTKWTHPASGQIMNSGSGLQLTAIPNSQALINARFTHPTPVRTSSVVFRAFDRETPSRSPSGCVVYACEVIHPDVAQTNNGSGSPTWTQIGGNTTLSLVSSPGASGLSPNGTTTLSDRHDHYILLSVQPTQVGSISQLGFLLSLEYSS